jgi:uncharacterized membrane protein
MAVLFVPGYLLLGALFPRPGDLRPSLRLGLSLAVSCALEPPLGVLVSLIPGRIDRPTLVVALTVLALPCGAIAWLRARAAGPAGAGIRLTGRTIVRGAASGGLGLAILLAAVYAGQGFLQPSPTTELYVVGQNGRYGEYPTSARPGEPVTVTVGVNNLERRDVRYVLGARSDGRDFEQLITLDLAAGQRWQGPVTFLAPRDTAGNGARPVELVLRLAGQQADYRTVSLWLTQPGEREDASRTN